MSEYSPARSKLEAVSRISALTHSPPETLGPGSKERKSVLTNLALGLGLDVDLAASKPELGEQLARALGVHWDDSCWSAGQTITLDGLNSLLEGSERRLNPRGAAQGVLFEVPPQAEDTFVPARSKLEAVSRISALTHSPPETLGPGSKERKSVLTNLALGLGLDVDLAASKPELGEQLARALGVHWDDSCWSAGQTITLDGLNTLLGGAESRTDAGRRAVGLFRTPHDEGRSLLAVLGSALPRHLDGRRCVAEMQSADFSQWAQDEWVGFYFEFVGIPALVNTFGGGPRTIGSTRFDYGLAHTWDLKVHMAATGTAPLNDEASMRKAVSSEGGLGFLVLTGEVEYDEGDFRAWQKDFRSQHGKRARPRVSTPSYTRKSKNAFVPRLMEAFFFADAAALDHAIASGAITIMNQGRQPSGRARAPKFALNLAKARMSDVVLLAQEVL